MTLAAPSARVPATRISVRSGTPFTLFDCHAAVSACVRAVAAPDLPFSGTPVAVNGKANLYNYIAVPADAKNTSPGFQQPGLPALGPEFPVCGSGGCLINGGLGKDRFSSPGYYMLNFGAYKTFKLTERFSMQFRGEFYNLLNHHNQYVNVGNATTSAKFIQTVKGAQGGAGVSAGVAGPNDERRNVQIGAKIIF